MNLDAVNQMRAHLARLEACFQDGRYRSGDKERILTAAAYHSLYANLEFRSNQDSQAPSSGSTKVHSTVRLVPTKISHEILADWVYTPNCSGDKRILYIHGGGWCAGDTSVYRHLASQITRSTSCPVLIPRYRSAPAHRYPAALADCLAAYTYALVSDPSGRSQPAKVVVIGDSVGANLAIALNFILKQRNLHIPQALIALSPVCDCASGDLDSGKHLVATSWIAQCIENYLSTGADARTPTVSPIRGDLNCLAPFLVQVGEQDPVLDQCTYLVDKARQAGVDANIQLMPGMPHAFQRFSPLVPHARRAVEHLSSFTLSRDHGRYLTNNIIYPKFQQTSS